MLAASFILAPGAGTGGQAAAQTIVVGGSSSDPARAVLEAMAAQAGVIFAGQVLAVTRNDAAGFVDIRFRIDLAVRGCPQSGAYVLREWAGLWGQGPADRYLAGQSYLMLLTARGPSGMSAPVGGNDGAIRLTAPVDPGVVSSSMFNVGNLAVDLRWLRADAVRKAAPLWAGSKGDDLNQPLVSAGGSGMDLRGAGPIAPLARVRREPSLAAILPWLRTARSEAHAGN